MRWRTTLTHVTEGSVVMSEPEGLVSAIIGLTRHPEFHTLVKEFKSAFRAYGSNGTQDGRRDWIKNIESTYGVDTVISILIEYAPDDYVFQTLYTGEVGIQTIVEGLEFDHYLEFTPVQTGMWRKFISRYDVPVDIQSALSLDGDAVTVYTPETLTLPSQVIRKTSIFSTTEIVGDGGSETGVTSVVKHGQIGISVTQQEISDTYDIPFFLWNLLSEIIETISIQENSIGDIITFSVDGDVKIDATASTGLITAVDASLNVMVNNDIAGSTQIAIAGSSPMAGNISETLHLTGTDTVTCVKGDLIKIYISYSLSIDTSANVSYSFGVDDMDITAVQDSISTDSTTQSFLKHDVAASILDRTTEPDKFYSELIGSQYTQARTYASAGDYWNNVLIKLIHARGYTLAEKLFSISFKNFWDGFSPMFNPSLGYETIGGVERIVIRTKAEAYDSSSMSVLLSGVQRIKRKYGADYFNAVETGFSNGKIEDISGIDDPQKQTRVSILKNVGRKLSLLTTWIAQGLTIEQARRTTKTKSADYKYDDNIAIIEVTRTGANTYDPRLNEDFDSVTNLLNEDSRYNKHHTPARFFLRWLDYVSGGLQKYLGTVFRFTSGEGNYDMVSEMVPGSAPDDYGGNPLAENTNIDVGTTFLWVPKVFEIEHYLTFAEFLTIDANRNKAIGISQTDVDHAPFFIDDLQMEIMTGQIKIVGKFKNEFDIITVPPGGQIFQGGQIFDSTFDVTFE